MSNNIYDFDNIVKQTRCTLFREITNSVLSGTQTSITSFPAQVRHILSLDCHNTNFIKDYPQDGPFLDCMVNYYPVFAAHTRDKQMFMSAVQQCAANKTP